MADLIYDIAADENYSVEMGHFAAADGSYIGRLVAVPYQKPEVQETEEPIFDDVPKTRTVRRPVREDRGDHIRVVNRDVEEPVTVSKPVKDSRGKQIDTAKVPVLERKQVGTRKVRSVVHTTVQPDIPPGAVEVPQAPEDPESQRWNQATGQWE